MNGNSPISISIIRTFMSLFDITAWELLLVLDFHITIAFVIAFSSTVILRGRHEACQDPRGPGRHDVGHSHHGKEREE